MNRIKKVRGLAMQAYKEGDISILENWLLKDEAQRKAKRKNAKMERKKNRPKNIKARRLKRQNKK